MKLGFKGFRNIKLVRMIRHRKREFDARIKMEKAAQNDVDARLKAVEIRIQNQQRRSGIQHNKSPRTN